jgi:hypothetical protein
LSGNPDVVLQSNEDDEHVEASATVPVDVAADVSVAEAATRKRKH